MSAPEPPPYPGDPNSAAENSGQSDLPSYGSVPAPESPGSVPPPPPPGPSEFGTGDFSAPDAIAWGWLKFTQNIVPVLVASAIIFIVSIGLGFLTGFAQASPMEPGSLSVSALSPSSFVGQLVQTIVALVLTGVAAKAALDVADGNPYDFFGAFGKVNYVNLIVASIVVGLVALVGFFLLLIPGLIVVFLTYLTTYSVVDDGKSPIDAIKHSVSLVSANLGGAFVLALLNVVVIIAGFIALCVGALVALPVTMFSAAYAYRVFNGQPVAP